MRENSRVDSSITKHRLLALCKTTTRVIILRLYISSMAPHFWSRSDLHTRMGTKHIYTREDCPFCEEREKSEHVLWRWEHWKIIHNEFPYSGDHRHLMAVPKIHKTLSSERSQDEFAELPHIHVFMQEYFAGENYFSFTRESMANRSVEHLHIHFLAGRLQWKFLRKMLELQGFPIIEDFQI